MFNQMQCIDLSVPIDATLFEPTPVQRKIINHQQGADLLSLPLSAYRTKLHFLLARLKQKLGLGLSHKDFPEQKGLSLMHYQLTTHTGTHMDAPFHYSDVSHEGAAMLTIDQIPLEWCYGRGKVVDLSEEPWSPVVSLAEFLNACEAQSVNFQQGDIVLINTGSDQAIGCVEYFTRYRGLHVDVVKHLVAAEIKVIGIDSFSFDPPFHLMLNEYQATHNKECLWPAHFYGRKKPYCQLERLTNLKKLVAYKEFWISALPIKLSKADAAWCRVVAFVNPHKEN